MRKYIVTWVRDGFGNTVEDTSRNAKWWVQETGAEYVEIRTKSGEWVSGARRWGDGTITNVREAK